MNRREESKIAVRDVVGLGQGSGEHLWVWG